MFESMSRDSSFGGPGAEYEQQLDLIRLRRATVTFWLTVLGAAIMTWMVRSRELLPGEVALMRWTVDHLSGLFGVAGPVLDIAFTGLIPPAIFVGLAAVVL